MMIIVGAMQIKQGFLLCFAYFCVPFLYKTEINSLARVTKIMNMVKDGAYNYITSLYLTCVYK